MSHILIVDDKSENLYLLRMLLQGNGYVVEEASHGAEALDKARRSLPQLLISDILMPVMDGYSLLREWKIDPQLKAIPFVVYTATYINPKDERLALNLGADAFILKPAEPQAFMERIRDVLASNARSVQPPHTPQLEETDLFREYSEALVRKLEDKMRQLEETNRALLSDIAERKRAEQALQRQRERLQHLRTIDQSILASHSVQEIAQAAVLHSGQLIPSTRVALVLVDTASATISLYALQLRGKLQDVPSLHAPLQILGEAVAPLTQGQVYAIADLAALPDVPPALRAAQVEGVRAYFYTPILAGDDLIAILNIGSDQPGAFTAEHLDIAREVADQLSIALQQARLREALTLHAQELEERVAARTAELTAANNELEAFSYSVSHDLRAPLRAIDGFTRLLLEEYVASLPDEGQQYVHYIRENTQRMSQLIDDLLAFSHLSHQPLNKHMVNVGELVRQCIQELRAEQVGRQIEIRIGELPACQGDVALLKQVWFNLLANALKYTRKRETAEIVIGSQMDGGETLYFVKDNGAGFDMRYSEKLFGVFQRLHEPQQYEGTGIGLALVQRIIQRHGGSIWAEAEVNRGATFFFTLAEASRDG